MGGGLLLLPQHRLSGVSHVVSCILMSCSGLSTGSSEPVGRENSQFAFGFSLNASVCPAGGTVGFQGGSGASVCDLSLITVFEQCSAVFA